MNLTDDELRLIRDEIGDGPPTDDELYELADPAGVWQEVAVSVLKRRRAAALGGGTDHGASESIQIPGVLGYSRGASLTAMSLAALVAALDAQIARLSGQVGLPSGLIPGGQLVRTDVSRYRGRVPPPAERFIERSW
jgi:hypothetical protein